MAKLAKIINGYPFDSDKFHSSEGMPLIRIRDIGQTETATRYRGAFIESAAVTSEDVLIGMDGDFNVGRWMGEGRALLNQRMCCVRGISHLTTRLLEYSLSAPLKLINDLTYATTVKHLSSSQVEKIRIAMSPNASEQSCIVFFLDRETAKIDALVAEQRRLMELLKEKRQAVISHAVTKGLNPDVPMKDSGVEGIGRVPAHWQVTRLKWVAEMQSGHTPDKKIDAYWRDGDIPWVSLNDTGFLKDNDFISDTAYSITQAGIENSSARLLPSGVVVFSRDATIGRCAITTRPMAVSQHFIAWVCSSMILPEFLLLRLRSMTWELDRLTTGATLKTIGMPDVRTLMSTVPPVDEQRAIVAYVGSTNASIDALSSSATRAIALLLERRSALISAAVTGQIDVRGLSSEAAS